MYTNKAMRVAFVRANNIESEPRLINLREAVQKSAETVLILWNRTSKEVKREIGVNRLGLPAPYGKKILLYLPIWWVYVIVILIRVNPTIVHACNIESVIPSWLYTVLFRKKLVYDIWDTASGMFGGNNQRVLAFTNAIESFFVRRAHFVFVPDVERFAQLGATGEILAPGKYLVVYNSFPLPAIESREISFSEHRPIVLSYVGVLSRRVRGLEWLIKTVALDADYSLHVAGYGPDSRYFETYYNDASFPNITFHGQVEYAVSRAINADADIVVTLLDPSFPNYRYATSTKIFEAFSLQKPIITTKNTASGRIVEETGWGLAIDFNLKSLEAALEKIKTGKTVFTLKGEKVAKFDWNLVAEQVREVYKRLESA